MIDLLFAGFLALIGLGTGKRILDRFGQTPEHPLDAIALALPLGMGLMALGTLARRRDGLAEPDSASRSCWQCGWNWACARQSGSSGNWAADSRSCREIGTDRPRAGSWPSAWDLALLGTALVAIGPVTDGDALCYHLQVPKEFLMHGSVGFDPDLHETVYPLVTELLYLPALEFRGPGACRWIQWVLGLVLFANVTALARPSLGRRAWWAGTIVLLAPAISNGMSAPLNDVALAAFGTAAIFAWTRMLERPSLRRGGGRGRLRRAGDRREVPGPGPLRPPDGRDGVPESCQTSEGDTTRRSWLAMAAVYAAAAILVGGWWYLRAYLHTGNPVYPFFRHVVRRGGAG